MEINVSGREMKKKAARILVIDDEKGILDMLRYELTQYGYEVITAGDGEEGVEKAKNENIDIVISDVKMPKLDGLGVIEKVKQLNPAIEIIMMAGIGSLDLTVECIRKGAYDFINKPFNLDELMSKVYKALEKQKLSSEVTSLKEISRLKSEFLSNTSHELRTPMNAIIGYTSLMLDKVYGDLTEKQATALRRIGTNANNLLQLINNILDISKLVAGKINLYVEDFGINELVEEVVDMMESIAREKKITLAFVKPANDIILHSDRTRLKQILINLIGNSLKFTGKGGVTVLAYLRNPPFEEDKTKEPAPETLNWLNISVKDTGIGIKPEAMETIFEEFRQADASTTREYGGTGLGLTIVKGLTEVLGGIIQVDSVFGQGSTFSVILPNAVQKEAVQFDNGLQKGETSEGNDNRKILLAIDDDPEVHKLLNDSLIGSEYKLVSALNGDEGIAFAKQLHPFAITLDVLLPHKDGWSILRSLKNDEETFSIPVVMLSVMDNKTLGFSLGVADYILKPFERKTLLERLEKLTDLKEKKVLLVDDDKDINLVIQSYLSNAGYTVFTALSGQEAMEIINKEKPDILLLDLMMPEMSGFDVLHAIQQNPELSDMRIIILTARKLTDFEEEELKKQTELIIEKSSKSLKEILADVKKRIEKNQA